MLTKRTFLAACLSLPVASSLASEARADTDITVQLTAMADASYNDPALIAADLVYIDTAKKVRKPAEAGNASAQNDLGVSYILGLDVDKDVATGVAWLEKAAAQGDNEAVYNLAGLYRSGTGVVKDPARAITLYLQAVAGGEPATPLAFMYCRGEGAAQNFANAAALFAKDADGGGLVDAYEAGLMAAIGRGAPQNLETAAFFLLIAMRIRKYPDAQAAYRLVDGALDIPARKRVWAHFVAWRDNRHGIP